MENYFINLEKKIKKNISFEKLEIIDNSYKHVGHKSFSKNKYHLHLKIKSTQLTSMSRIDAQKLVMKTLKEDLKKKIHALEISID